MYNYIDEVPETIQDKVDMFFDNKDYYMDADDILDSLGMSREEYWEAFDAAAEEAAKVNNFCEDMCITPSDLETMLEYYDQLPEIIEEEEYEAWCEDAILEDVAWYNYARSVGWE